MNTLLIILSALGPEESAMAFFQVMAMAAAIFFGVIFLFAILGLGSDSKDNKDSELATRETVSALQKEIDQEVAA